jgi:hypothetical protein
MKNTKNEQADNDANEAALHFIFNANGRWNRANLLLSNKADNDVQQTLMRLYFRASSLEREREIYSDFCRKTTHSKNVDNLLHDLKDNPHNSFADPVKVIKAADCLAQKIIKDFGKSTAQALIPVPFLNIKTRNTFKRHGCDAFASICTRDHLSF